MTRNVSDRKTRWGLVLAGGDAVRLKPLTRLISGDDRPKQFCALYGGMTLLEQTRRRVRRNVRDEQILFSLNRSHQDFYLRELGDCPSRRVVQPQNRGTAAAILSSLLLIARKDQDAAVAIFPSDHYFSDESVIVEAVERAFALSRREPDSVILIGARPHGPEVEYGWIEVGAPAQGLQDCFRVLGFHEKPAPCLAGLLLERGSLWNTFVIIGKVLTLLEMICSAMPGALTPFQQHPALRAADGELRIPDALYARIPSTDFSRQVLSIETGRLIVQQLGPVMWSDLGDADRAAAALSTCGLEPEWAARWRAAKPPRSAISLASLAAQA